MEKVALRKMHTRIRGCVPYMIMTRRMTGRLWIVVALLAKDHKIGSSVDGSMELKT